MVLNAAQSRLYVAPDNADVVSVIDTAASKIVSTVSTVAPAGLVTEMQYRGASSNGLVLSADEHTLYATNLGTNDVAVISLAGASPAVTRLIPTGCDPSDLAVGAANALSVVYTKNMPGPNPGNCTDSGRTVPCPVKSTPVKLVENQYIEQRSKGGPMWMPGPGGKTLDLLTTQVANNNSVNAALTPNDIATMAALRRKIKHVMLQGGGVRPAREHATAESAGRHQDGGARSDAQDALLGARDARHGFLGRGSRRCSRVQQGALAGADERSRVSGARRRACRAAPRRAGAAMMTT
ncbi:hypothetical protein DR62_5284 [Burkholderia thailandensis]|nr:hypothetical protein DR62_5284 [Burkholderia thailandensis]AOI54024.1 hypothetical protein WI24_19195 [Burkholderia thailandensis]